MSRFTDKELIELMREENKRDKTKADEVSAEIDREIRKAKPDYDRIAELSELYAELTGEHEKVQDSRSEHIQSIDTAMKNTRSKPVYMRFLTVAACIAMILFSANCVTVYAFDMNIFKAIVHFTQGGFSVHYDTVNDDSYGIRAECEKHGIYGAEVPTYLPDGFELETSEYMDLGVCDNVSFYYVKEGQRIKISYQMYKNAEDMQNTGYPSDYFNVEEINIHGKSAVVSKEDNQYTLVYANGNLLMIVFTQDVDYEECQKLTESIE